MRILYDPEGDVLDVIFDERLHRAEKSAFRLRDGLMLYLSADELKPVQLTVVNYLRLAQLPAFHFNGWQRIKAGDRKKFLPIINSPMLASFVKLDPKTGYGHLASQPLLDMFSATA
jgi:hypothetical protein